MPPKIKQKRRNGFSIFLDEYVESQRAIGRSISHRIGAEECAMLWEKMPPEERQPYVDRAAVQREYTRQEKESKFTTYGLSFADFDRKLEEERRKVERGEREIQKTMMNLNTSTVRNHLFYTIHCHYLVKLMEGIYMPGEIAICEFSLESGIRNTYHRLINPGPLPIGYGYEAKVQRETVHDLPIPPFEEGVSDYRELLRDIFEFIEPGRNLKGERPPFYALPDDIIIIENILLQFSNAGGLKDEYFRVLPLHKMFFALKNRCAELSGDESNGFPVLTNAITEIEKDSYRYVSGISCEYHTPSDRYYHSCSLSVVQRYVFLLCDHCCHLLDIPLIPGKHIRKEASVGVEVEEKPKEKSVDSPFLRVLESIGRSKGPEPTMTRSSFQKPWTLSHGRHSTSIAQEERPLPVEEKPIDYWDYTPGHQAAGRAGDERGEFYRAMTYRDRLMRSESKSSATGAAKPEPDYKKVFFKKRG